MDEGCPLVANRFSQFMFLEVCIPEITTEIVNAAREQQLQFRLQFGSDLFDKWMILLHGDGDKKEGWMKKNLDWKNGLLQNEPSAPTGKTCGSSSNDLGFPAFNRNGRVVE